VLFLTIDILFLLWYVCFPNACHVEKTVGTIYRAAGRSDPTHFFAVKAEKVGSLPPFWWFFHGDSCLHCVCIRLSSKKLLAHRVKKQVKTKVECDSLILPLFPQVPAQELQTAGLRV